MKHNRTPHIPLIVDQEETISVFFLIFLLLYPFCRVNTMMYSLIVGLPNLIHVRIVDRRGQSLGVGGQDRCPVLDDCALFSTIPVQTQVFISEGRTFAVYHIMIWSLLIMTVC